jgi:hypothetical protein
VDGVGGDGGGDRGKGRREGRGDGDRGEGARRRGVIGSGRHASIVGSEG